MPRLGRDNPGASGGAGDPATVEAGRLQVSYRGTDSIAGRDAFVIDLRTDGASPDAYNRTVWLDQEHFVMLEQRLAIEVDGERREFRGWQDNVSFGAEFSPGTFGSTRRRRLASPGTS